MRLKEIKTIYHKELDAIYPKEEVNSFFGLLIEHYLGLQRFVLALSPEFIITKEQELPLFESLAALRLQRPIQYIIGKAHFMDLDFKVNEDVLIPRPETEELVRWIIERCGSDHGITDWRHNKGPTILDIGTGSGCIAISLAKNLTHAKTYALDISRKALELAKQNARDLQVEIEFMEFDILKWKPIDLKFDIIVSNPPYVREMEKKEMHNNVTVYEPNLALFVPNDDPLRFYDTIIRFAKRHLNEKGYLYLEINQYLGKETQALLEEHNFSEIELRKDMFGNDRMLMGKLDKN